MSIFWGYGNFAGDSVSSRELFLICENKQGIGHFGLGVMVHQQSKREDSGTTNGEMNHQ